MLGLSTAVVSGGPYVVAVAMLTDFQADLHVLLNRQYRVFSGHWSWVSGPGRHRAAILKLLMFLRLEIFRCRMEHER
jgi:hypothetical protein